MSARRRVIGPSMATLLVVLAPACAPQPVAKMASTLNARGLCPPQPRDTLGRQVSYVAYVIDGQLLPKVTRNVSTGHHSSMALDTLPELALLRTADIEDITVVHGAEAEARYGVCPGHGVVVITTKRVTPNGKLPVAPRSE